jgi:hypothetical protein
LLLLNEAAQGPLVLDSDAVLKGAPDLEILGGIAVLILGGPLPSDEEGAAGREADLIDNDDLQ